MGRFRMSLVLEFIHKIIQAYHEDCIKNILAKKNVCDDIKMLLIGKHLNYLKQVDKTYDFADTIDKLKELLKRN